MVDNESQEMYLETILRLKKKKGSRQAVFWYPLPFASRFEIL